MSTVLDQDTRIDVYLRLRNHLDRLPAGYPTTESGVEMRILEKLFTPEEAEMATHLRFFPEPASVIARRLGRPEAKVAKLLDTMVDKGLVMLVPSGKHKFYMAAQWCVGIFEFNNNKMDHEFAELSEAYELASDTAPLNQFRVVPISEAVDGTSTIASYDQARAMVSKEKLAAVTTCICKQREGLLTEECSRPTEVCLSFNVAARMYIDTGKGREISIREALGVLDQAEENALVLMSTNSRDIINICCCCSCCCALLHQLKRYPRPAEMVRSAFVASVDSSLCKGCKKCIKRCQMDAVIEGDKKVSVDANRCIGCGLCVTTCKQAAMTLKPKAAAKVPFNWFDMLSGMSKKRGLGFGNLNLMMKVAKVPLMVKMLPLLYKSGMGRPMVDLLAKLGWV